MRSKIRVCAVLVLVGAALACVGQSTAAQRGFMDSQYGRIPLTFEANQGQTAPQVKFISRGPGYRAYLTADGMVLSLRSSATNSAAAQDSTAVTRGKRAAIQIRLVGALSNPAVIGEDPQPGRMNYFIGNDARKWRRNVPTYGQVRYKNIYRGIDLVYYGNHEQLEYDFAIAPKADPRQIRFEITGASNVQVAADGSLALQTEIGVAHFQVPLVYQDVKGSRVPVKGSYSLLDSNHVQFEVANYDTEKSLIIDPVLIYSSYLGGTGSEQPSGIAVDANGNVYVAGSTDSTDFPLGTIGLLPSGSPHVYIAKLDPTGSHLIYADYLGGSSQDYGYALALDASSNVFVTGSTASSDFPMVQPFQGTYPGSFNAFLSKVSSDGSSLLYSSYFGGNGSDIPSGVAVDQSGNIVLAGYTSSTNLTTANAFQSSASPNQGGTYGQYGFLTKFAPNGASLIYSTYFGGSSNVALNCGGTPCWPQPSTSIAALAIDAGGDAYLTGSTNTYNFPVTQGAYLTTNSSQMNTSIGFVSKFTSAGSLQYSTYFYGSSGLQVNITGIAADSAGSAYITGAALSDGTFPVTSTNICDPGTQGWACSYAFVTKFDNAGATLLYSTFLGPNNGAIPYAVALDGNNDAYVLAFTSGGTFNSVDGIEPYSGGNDLLITEIDASGTTQVFATYFGGSGDEQPTPAGLALDANGNLYIAGVTTSTDLPVTPSAYQSASAGNTDSFIVKMNSQSAPAVTLKPTSLQFALQAIGTTGAAQNVVLRNMGSAALAISSMNAIGDFSETNNCGSSVPAEGGTCTIAVSFTPTAAGTRTGSISIQDNAAGAPHVIALSGVGTGPGVGLAPQSLTFPGIPAGTTSSARAVTLTNTGDQVLSATGITISGSFAQTNNCPSTLNAGSNCVINVTFTPSNTGANSGTLTITDNAFGGSQIVPLNGTGSDFSITGSVKTASIKAGATATYSLSVAPVGGSFTNAVTLSCSGAPSYATCSVSQSTVTPGSNAVSFTLSVKTSGKTTQSAQANQLRPLFAMFLQLQGFGVFGIVLAASDRRKKKLYQLLILALLVGALFFMSACAGGTGIASQSTNVTPSGTYTITVSGSSGSLQHSLPVTLTVQ